MKKEIEQNEIVKSQSDSGIVNENNEDVIKIYSRSAIMGFSVFFTTVFGGVLLMQNFKDIGNKKMANTVLIFSILYTALSAVIILSAAPMGSSLTIVMNIIGGVILNEFFFRKYFSTGQELKHKKIWKPLIISLIITLPFIIALFIWK